MSYEGISPAFAQALLGKLNGESISAPVEGWELGLYSTLFDAAGVAIELASGSSPGYAPALLAASPLAVAAPAGRLTKNATPIMWPINSSTNTPWQTAIAVAIGKKTGSSSTLPKVCAFGKLDTGWSNDPGNRLYYPVNRFQIRMFADDTRISQEEAEENLQLFQGAAINPPNHYFLGLGADVPDRLGNIAEITDLARVQIPCVGGTWVAGSTVRRRTNASIYEFVAAPANLPRIKSFGLFTDPRAAGGNAGTTKPRWFGEVTAEKVIYFEDIIVILSGGMELGL